MKSFLTEAQPTQIPKPGTSPFSGLIADEEFLRIFPAWKKVLRRSFEEALSRDRTRTAASIFTSAGEGGVGHPQGRKLIPAAVARDAHSTGTEIQQGQLVKTSFAFEKSVVVTPWPHGTKGRSI